VVPYQRFVHDFPNLEPSHVSRITFKRWTYGSAALFGIIFAGLVTDKRILQNEWYNRPDLKPFPAMVAVDEEVEKKMKYVKLAHYVRFKN